MKKVVTVLLILAIVFSEFGLYFTYFVSTPADTVQSFFDSCDELDVSGMMDCLDPKTKKAYSAIAGLASSFLGADIEALADIVPLFSDFLGENSEKFEVSDVQVLSYSGKKLEGFIGEVGNRVKGVGNVLGEQAVVQFCVNLQASLGLQTDTVPDSVDGQTRVILQLTVKNYGSDGWRIPADAEFIFVGMG